MPDIANADEEQVFDVREAIKVRAERPGGLPGRVDMAQSANCYVALFSAQPRGGEPTVHSHPDSDQILFLLGGECLMRGLGTEYLLKAYQGALVPAGVNYGFTNVSEEQLILLTLRTEATGGRQVGYVPNVPSDAEVRIPEALISAKGIGQHMYVYAIDRQTIGVSPLLLEEWNRAGIARMNCEYRRSGQDIVVSLPERLALWYQVDDLTDGDYSVIADQGQTRVRIDLSAALARRVAHG